MRQQEPAYASSPSGLISLSTRSIAEPLSQPGSGGAGPAPRAWGGFFVSGAPPFWPPSPAGAITAPPPPPSELPLERCPRDVEEPRRFARVPAAERDRRARCLDGELVERH